MGLALDNLSKANMTAPCYQFPSVKRKCSRTVKEKTMTGKYLQFIDNLYKNSSVLFKNEHFICIRTGNITNFGGRFWEFSMVESIMNKMLVGAL